MSYTLPAATGILLDGHNRLAIAQKHDLPYRTQDFDLPDRAAAREWIITNQLGRRNLAPNARAYLRGSRTVATERPTGRPPKGSNNLTLSDMAEAEGVTEQTLRNDAKFAEAVIETDELVPGFRDKALGGDLPKKAAPLTAGGCFPINLRECPPHRVLTNSDLGDQRRVIGTPSATTPRPP